MVKSTSIVAFVSSTLLPVLVNAGATGISPSKPPHTVEAGQYGYNDCYKYSDSPSSECQNLWINSLDDFCLFAPPKTANIGDSERYEVSYCSKAGHGTRLFPKGTITGASMVKTPYYVQITGTGDFTKIQEAKGDEGGELDPHGYDGLGNPIGGLVFGLDQKGKSTIQFTEWTEFIGSGQFCIRACYPGTHDKQYCGHIYDEMGCYWNMPGTYETGKFETCKGDKSTQPMGIYKVHGTSSTWHQGTAPTPAAHPASPSSSCVDQKTIPVPAYPTGKARREVKEFGIVEDFGIARRSWDNMDEEL